MKLGERQHSSNKGSITLEASLILPVFIYSILSLCCIFLYMQATLSIKLAMIETAREISSYGDAVSHFTTGASDILFADDDYSDISASSVIVNSAWQIAGDMAEAVIIRALLENKLKNTGIFDVIQGGAAGIDCFGSKLFTDQAEVIICCNYSFKMPVLDLNFQGLKRSQSFTMRCFTGNKVESLLEDSIDDSEEESADGEMVFITETGHVFHYTMDCPSLRLTIRAVSVNDVGNERNVSGGKYYKCEKCAKGALPETLYITSDGDRFHYLLECSGLKRTVNEVELSAVEGRRACKRCNKKAN